MGVFFLYGSFPNSRIEPTPATTMATTQQVTCPGGVATQILGVDLNRTYLNIRNLDQSIDVYYGYAPGLNALNGQLLKALEAEDDIQSSEAIYIFVPAGPDVIIGYDQGEG